MGHIKRPRAFSLMRMMKLLPLTAIAFSANAQDARELYDINCASCHGDKLQGTGLGPALSPESYAYGGSRGDITRIVNNGITSQGMPSFKDKLSEAEIAALAEFLPVREAKKSEQQENADEDGIDSIPGKVSTLDYLVNVEVVAEGLHRPWAVAFLDKNTMLVTERSGTLRLVKKGKLMDKPIKNTPKVLVNPHKWNQGGLLDVAVDPNYAKNGWVYLCFSHPITDSSVADEPLGMIRIVRGKIKNHKWTKQEVIYDAPRADYNKNFYHYGGRMVFDTKGDLYFSIGDRGTREQAREPSKAMGKIHRIHANGDIPKDNPMLSNKEALPSIFSLGHRNPQGLALEPNSGKVWASEHGPRGGDELNILKPAADYGWSFASYGINYDGTLLTPNTKAEGIEQPVLYWRPSIAVSGITFYQGKEFSQWQDKLLVTGLRTRDLRLLTIDNGRVQHEEILIKFKGRPYEPVVGPDGAIYVALAEPGRVLRITAVEQRKI